MTKKELEELVKRQSEQIAELTKMMTAMRKELQARRCNDITNVMPKVYPQPYSPITAPYSPITAPYSPITAPLPRWWEEAKMWN